MSGVENMDILSASLVLVGCRLIVDDEEIAAFKGSVGATELAIETTQAVAQKDVLEQVVHIQRDRITVGFNSQRAAIKQEGKT